MSINLAVKLFATATLIVIIDSHSESSASWPVVDRAKHWCDEQKIIIAKAYKAIDCHFDAPAGAVSGNGSSSRFEFTALAVRMGAVPGDDILNTGGTGYAMVFNDFHVQVSEVTRLGSSEADLSLEYIKTKMGDDIALVSPLRSFLGLPVVSGNKSMVCTESSKKVEFTDDGSYTLSWAPADLKSFKIGTGYNTQWMGCPQALCLDANLDAVMVKNEDVIIVRGIYIWDVASNPPEQSDAYAITQVKLEKGQTVKPVYFESGYFSGQFNLIVFGSFYTATEMSGPYAYAGKANVRGVEAAFINKNQLVLISLYYTDKTKIFNPYFTANSGKGSKCIQTISDGNFTAKRASPSVSPCKPLNNNELKSNINAMFILKDELYVLKGWKYALLGKPDAFLASSGAVQIQQWQYAFLNVLACDTEAYKDWGAVYGFHYYRDFLDNHFDRPKSDLASVHVIALVDLIILIIFEVILIILAFIYWNKYRKESEMGLLSMMKAFNKGGRQGVGARFKRAKMEKEKMSETRGSKLDVRRSKMSQLDIIDLPESRIGGKKMKSSRSGAGSSRGSAKTSGTSKASKSPSKKSLATSTAGKSSKKSSK